MLTSLLRRFIPSIVNKNTISESPVATADAATLNSILDEFWDLHWQHLDDAEGVERTLRLYLRPAFGARPVNALSRDELLRWHQKAEHRRVPSMANRAIKLGRQVWRALRPGELNPFADIPLYPIRQRTRVFSEDERARFATALEGMLRPKGRGKRPKCTEVVADAIWCVRGTGGRRSEVLSLRREQIDLRAELAYLDEHKTDDDEDVRTLQLTNCMDVIRRRCDICDKTGNPWLFPSPKKSASGHVENIDAAFHEACRRAEMVRTRGLSPHALRRDLATKLLNGGTDLRVCQKVLGHRNIASTSRYARANDETARRAVRNNGVKREAQEVAVPRPTEGGA
ncbi:Phage integrase family protein [Nannocystis exedens]|uniref:Phage integrase family protein n=1 Tax=Nannocystis exedens TaxID=54 RepID=A0A1I2IMF0_9BACT|nr:tyrosine-type recombinase/integrase [Nannocystis exedens]PCC73119.1 Tyrosine recombinase XerD [Nannocystis exedens]SFF41701.1 Phage integrase family protein [Nannocystis exedens]